MGYANYKVENNQPITLQPTAPEQLEDDLIELESIKLDNSFNLELLSIAWNESIYSVWLHFSSVYDRFVTPDDDKDIQSMINEEVYFLEFV